MHITIIGQPSFPQEGGLFYSSTFVTVQMAAQYTLGKKERLKSRKQTEQLFSKGNKFTTAPFRVHYLYVKGEGPVLQFGAGVSARQFKRAVDRNRVKRLIREAYRVQKIPLQQQVTGTGSSLFVFFIYTGRELPGYQLVFEKMGKTLAKLREIISAQP